METLARNGAEYRTKLMSLPRAEGFVKCLRANRRFDGVGLAESPRSVGRYYVVFLPASDPSGSKILARQQAARDARAAAQVGDYDISLDADVRCPGALISNRRTGAAYNTTVYDCNCPDYIARCAGSGCTCKHMGMLATAIAQDEAQRAQDEARWAEAERMRRLLWD